MKKILFVLLLGVALATNAKQGVIVTVQADQPGAVIDKNIYGHFAEHLGSCIYGGLWVGEDSSIPNTNGYRNDVLNALKELKVPIMRWPGGCFADEYHWMDGIGPKENRPRMVNSNWGGVVEDNSFGTHEFLNLCELLECEPYISMNVGSGSVEEAAKWVEYMNAAEGPMANLRKENGREEPWQVTYIGVGNESWGCGGTMRPEYYADLYRRYQTYCRDYNGKGLYKIASGASDYDFEWTDVLMNRIGNNNMSGISLHYYTVWGWEGSKGSATDFDDESFYWCLGKGLGIEPIIQKHIAIMDKYDPDKTVDLLIDEWGTWWDSEPGTQLYQQNTIRDAFVAALSFNVFHKYTDRIKMGNIAQIANVLQSMVLTKDDQMVLTPTYHVFKMYQPHQDAVYLPSKVENSSVRLVLNERFDRGHFDEGDIRPLPTVNVTSSKSSNGTIGISLSNVDIYESQKVTINLNGFKAKKVSGTILSSQKINDHNTFNNSDKVKTVEFKGAKISKDGSILVDMPPLSIITLVVE